MPQDLNNRSSDITEEIDSIEVLNAVLETFGVNIVAC